MGVCMPEETVGSLGEFINRVSKLREWWGLPKHKELWFRGESRDYGETILRPELYRPASSGAPLKSIAKRLHNFVARLIAFERVSVDPYLQLVFACVVLVFYFWVL